MFNCLRCNFYAQKKTSYSDIVPGKPNTLPHLLIKYYQSNMVLVSPTPSPPSKGLTNVAKFIPSTVPITSAKTKIPSLDLFSLLYPQTQKNEIEVSLKYGIGSMFMSVLWVVAMLFPRAATSVPTFAKVTTSTWRTVYTSFGNITNHLSAFSYVAQFDLSSRGL